MSFTKKQSIICVGILLAIIVSAGCQSRKPGVQFVTGKVTVDGQPLEGASIVFTPKPGTDAPQAGGMTDVNGVYTIQTPTGKVDGGAKTGNYFVTFRKTKIEAVSKNDSKVAPPRVTNLLPSLYESPDTTPFSATVTEGGGKKNHFDFDLKSKP